MFKIAKPLSVLFLLISLIIHPTLTVTQEINSEEHQIKDYIQQNLEEAISLLGKAVNINSGSLNAKGVREVGQLFRSELDAIGFETRWISFDESIKRGGHLYAERKGTQGKSLLLIGHLDTVFEKDSPFQHFERSGDTLSGPGIADMKDGDVVIVFALKALHQAGVLEGTTIRVVLIGDEEKPGGPIAIVRRDLIDAAKQSDIALGFEGSVDPQKATVARRGFTGWTLNTKGIQGHSGQIFSETYGDGAIYEVARILNAFRKDVRGAQYLTFNPGVIVGGTTITYDASTSKGTAFGKPNVIARTATVEGGLRFISEEQRERAIAKMNDVVARHLPGTSATITFESSYPAMEPKPGNHELLRIFSKTSQDLGLGTITSLDPSLRGGADISFVASIIDSLSGLGPAGEGAHSPQEKLDVRAVEVAATRAAVFMYRLTR